jgi:hypothetical protein
MSKAKAKLVAAIQQRLPGATEATAKQLVQEALKPKDKQAELLVEAFKTAALGTSLTSAAKSVGKFNGFSTAHSLKAPGMAGSQTAINPRRSITSAINAFKA